MRRRRLSEEEKSLWETVAKTAAPLRPRPKEEPVPAPPAKRKAAPVVEPPVADRKPLPSSPPTDFDRRTRLRLARGMIAVDGRLDLHGHTRERAHRRLLQFIAEMHRQDRRVVLVITGKGAEAGSGERGVLRREVPLWLASPEFRPFVSGIGEAHRTHGGEGALYVRLRRRAANRE